jgi:hypothetical protein
LLQRYLTETDKEVKGELLKQLKVSCKDPGSKIKMVEEAVKED